MRFTARPDACSVGTMRPAGADAGGELELFGDEGEVASTFCADVCFGAERHPDEVRRMAPAAPEIAAPAACICRRCRRIPGASKSLAPALRIIAADNESVCRDPNSTVWLRTY